MDEMIEDIKWAPKHVSVRVGVRVVVLVSYSMHVNWTILCLSCLKSLFLLSDLSSLPFACYLFLTWWFSPCLPRLWLFVLLHFPPGDWPTGWKWARSRIQSPLKSLSVSFCFPAPSASFHNYSLLPAASLANSCLSLLMYSVTWIIGQ